jgi:eukaryotic-like serine/threonine-protein kinase
VETSIEVSAEAIRTQLDKILVSPGFVHSDRMVRFLRFTVAQTLKGHASELKETVLGMEVFDRPSSFDPRTDTIVRVEARRLRSKLKEYYETHGQRDEVLIEFPKGSYVPTFLKSNDLGIRKQPARSQASHPNEAESLIPSVATTSTRPARLPIIRAALALVALLGAGGATLCWRLRPPPAPVEWRLRPVTEDSGLTATPALSPDGKLAAYASDRASNGTNLDLWVQPLTEGSQTIRLTQNPADDKDPSFSPDGQIAFFSRRDGGGIYLIPTFGGAERLLMRGGSQPSFSPDGRWVAYAVGGSYLADSKVFVMPAGGGAAKRIAADIPWASEPVWSPDGRHLLVLGAAATNDPASMEFWLVSPGGRTSVKTGLASVFRPRLVPKSDWIGDALFFGGLASIWTIGFKNGSPQPSTLRKLASGTTEMANVHGTSLKLVFETRTSADHLWSLPLDLNSGKVRGPMQPLPHAGGSQMMPSSSSDGRRLVYLQAGFNSQELRLRDMSSGSEKALLTGHARPKISPDGAKVAYTTEGSGLFLMDSSGGEATKLLDWRGSSSIYGWSADGKRIVYWDGTPISFSVFDLETRQASVLLSHPTYDIHGADLSPDGKWVAFHLRRPVSELLKIAPVRQGKAAAEANWITVAATAGRNNRPWWSPDGNLLYFLSTRDSYSCIWAQALDPATKSPRGEPMAVYHFYETRRSQGGAAFFGPAVGGGRIVFALAEQSGNIWLAEPAR